LGSGFLFSNNFTWRVLYDDEYDYGHEYGLRSATRDKYGEVYSIVPGRCHYHGFSSSVIIKIKAISILFNLNDVCSCRNASILLQNVTVFLFCRFTILSYLLLAYPHLFYNPEGDLERTECQLEVVAEISR